MAAPDKLIIGASATWTATTPDYSADDSYALSYEFSNAEYAFSISGNPPIVPDGTTHTVTITPTISETWEPGEYSWRAFASKSGEKWLVARGEWTIEPDLAGNEYDGRSHVKKTLDALEATIENKATRDQSSVSIEGRSLSRMSPAELDIWRRRYQHYYRQEQDAARIAAGLPSKSRILARFVDD